MIKNFRHKGLRFLYENSDRRKVSADHADKISRVLARLDQADVPANMDLPGFRLHKLSGDLDGFWSVVISGNWRLIFRFVDGYACDVDLVDYH